MPKLEGETPNEQQPESSGDVQQSDASALDYSKIDWSKFDWSKVPVDKLPEEVIKETPTAKKLLKETIERRQTIKTLKEALDEKPAEVEPKTPAKKPDVSDDTPEWARQIMQKISSLEQDTQEQKLKAAVSTAMKENKLPPNAEQFLTGSTVEEINKKAVELAKMFVPNDPTKVGNPSGSPIGDIQSRALDIIKQRVEGSKPVGDKSASIFDTRIQSIK